MSEVFPAVPSVSCNLTLATALHTHRQLSAENVEPRRWPLIDSLSWVGKRTAKTSSWVSPILTFDAWALYSLIAVLIPEVVHPRKIRHNMLTRILINK